MKTRLRAVALSATAVVALSGCAMLPFEIVPRDSEETPTADVEEEATEEPVAEETTFSHSGQQGDDEGTLFEQVVEVCDLPESALGDEGKTLILDMEGEEPGTGDLTFEDTGCALGAMGTSDAVLAQMSDTSAFDGRQTAEDGSREYSWTYHPDQGLDIIVTNRV